MTVGAKRLRWTKKLLEWRTPPERRKKIKATKDLAVIYKECSGTEKSEGG